MPLLNSPNHFLASLSPRDSDLLRRHLKALQLRQGTVIYSAEETIEHVYFPHTGVVSVVVGLTSEQFVEAGMLGRNSGLRRESISSASIGPSFCSLSHERVGREIAEARMRATSL